MHTVDKSGKQNDSANDLSFFDDADDLFDIPEGN